MCLLKFTGRGGQDWDGYGVEVNFCLAFDPIVTFEQILSYLLHTKIISAQM